MSSGYNGISHKSVGRFRTKLAKMISRRTGWIVEPADIQSTNPTNRHFEDCCSWDCWATVPADGPIPDRKVHIYSWSNVTECCAHDFVIDPDGPSDYSISPCDASQLKKLRDKCDHTWSKKLQLEPFRDGYATCRICSRCGFTEMQ